MSQHRNPNYYHTAKNMVCDDASKNMHFFGHFSPYFQSQCYYDELQTNQSTPITKHNPTNCYDDTTKNELKINKQVQISSSEYTAKKLALERTKASNDNKNVCVFWHNGSDRKNAAVVTNKVPSHGNSKRTSLTRHRPGSMSAPGTGVDVKHDSYQRYLLKIKGKMNKC
jgi:hypothetical protein